MNPPRAVIVGAGLMGRWHAAYARRAGARIVAIVDPNPTAADSLHRRFPSARLFTDLAQCLDAEKPDVVHICTPSGLHAAQAEAALRAGAHVVVEKPAADSPDSAAHLLDAAREAGRQIIAVHQFSFQRGFQRLLRRWPDLGEVVRIEFRAATAGAEERPAAARRRVLREIVPHPVYLLHRLLGAQCLDARSWLVLHSTEDDLEMAACYGATTVSVAISLLARPTCNELLVWGTRGRAVVDLYHGYCLFDSVRGGRWGKIRRPLATGANLLLAACGNLAWRGARREWAYPGLLDLLRWFYRSIQSGGAPPIPGDEIIAVARMMEWVDHAATQTPPVKLGP